MSDIVRPTFLPLPIEKNPFLNKQEDINKIQNEPIIDPIEFDLNDTIPSKIFYYYHVFSRIGLNYSIVGSTQSTQGGNNTTFFSPDSRVLLRITKNKNKSLYSFNGKVANTPYGRLFLGYTLHSNYKTKKHKFI